MEKSVCPMLEAAILFSFRREMGQITLRKSTTGTVVNHKEESSLRGEEFVIGGEEARVSNTSRVWPAAACCFVLTTGAQMFDDFQSGCPRPSHPSLLSSGN